MPIFLDLGLVCESNIFERAQSMQLVWQVMTFYLKKREGKGLGTLLYQTSVFTTPVAGVGSKVMNIY